MAQAHQLLPSTDFSPALSVADSVLYEGYLLYPYRRSSAKNQIRCQFGVLAPRAWVEGSSPEVGTGAGDTEAGADGVAGSAESWWNRTEVLIEATGDARVDLVLRFLRLRPTGPVPGDGAGPPGDAFDRGEPGELAATVTLADAAAPQRLVLVDRDPDRGPDGALEITAQRLASRTPLYKLSVRVENTVADVDPARPRTEVLRRSLVATHLLLGTTEGSFLSLLDPPAWAAAAVAECRNVRTFPVLAGPPGRSDLVLSAPIILYDHPQVAPESPGDLFDATEIDEILSLRTLTLTDEEKAEARATDPRAAAVIDRVDGLPPEVFGRLHGAVRSLRPVARDRDGARRPGTGGEPGGDEAGDEALSVVVAGQRLSAGSRVRLRPRSHGTDAQDMFLAGRSATVALVLTDVDGTRFLAVTIDDDPRREVPGGPGGLRHFVAEEVEPL